MEPKPISEEHLQRGAELLCLNNIYHEDYLTVGKIYTVVSLDNYNPHATDEDDDPIPSRLCYKIALILDDDNDVDSLLDVKYEAAMVRFSMFTPMSEYTEEEQFIIRIGGLDAL